MHHSLNTLNLLPAPHPHSQNTEGGDDVLAGGSELNASLAQQLELWTNIAFSSDEPAPQSLPSLNDNKPHVLGSGVGGGGGGGEDFDLDGFLSQFSMGVDPFAHANVVMPTYATQGQHQGTLAMLQQQQQQHAPSSPGGEQPPAKRQRARKMSIAMSVASTAEEDSKDGTEHGGSNPLTPAEDKRRRNTAASARFRLKKKEREAAMERNLKGLEQRVAELEREADGLRKENGWLRGLLVNGAPPKTTKAEEDADTEGAKKN